MTAKERAKLLLELNKIWLTASNCRAAIILVLGRIESLQASIREREKKK